MRVYTCANITAVSMKEMKTSQTGRQCNERLFGLDRMSLMK